MATRPRVHSPFAITVAAPSAAFFAPSELGSSTTATSMGRRSLLSGPSIRTFEEMADRRDTRLANQERNALAIMWCQARGRLPRSAESASFPIPH